MPVHTFPTIIRAHVSTCDLCLRTNVRVFDFDDVIAVVSVCAPCVLPDDHDAVRAFNDPNRANPTTTIHLPSRAA